MSARTLFRFLWCLVGATIGLSLTLLIAGPAVSPFLLASLGGSTVFLFGLSSAPAAQPRALFGGHLGGALCGIACYQWCGESPTAYVLAVVLALALMLLTRTVHPPAGANPLLMVSAHAHWAALWQPVLLGVGTLFLVAVIWSRLYPRQCAYPMAPFTPSPPRIDWGAWRD